MKKKIFALIAGIIVIVLAILSIFYFRGISIKKEKEVVNENEVMFEDIFSIQDFEKENIKASKSTNENIMLRYKRMSSIDDNANLEVSITDSNIEFQRLTGKILYIRNKQVNANIFQTKSKLITSQDQITDAIDEFSKICKEYLKIDDNQKPESELMYRMPNAEGTIPLYEGIYNGKLQYCLIYNVDESEYDINIYMADGQLIFELAKIFK